MQTTFSTQNRNQNFSERKRNQISAFIIVVNAEGPINENEIKN